MQEYPRYSPQKEAQCVIVCEEIAVPSSPPLLEHHLWQEHGVQQVLCTSKLKQMKECNMIPLNLLIKGRNWRDHLKRKQEAFVYQTGIDIGQCNMNREMLCK